MGEARATRPATAGADRGWLCGVGRQKNSVSLGRRCVTVDTDLRLCRFFGLSDGYWLRAQMAYDLELERCHMELELEKIRPLAIAAE